MVPQEVPRAADFTLTRFPFLVPLCLVHGRQSFHRTAFIAQFCFYKSIFVCCLQVQHCRRCCAVTSRAGGATAADAA